MTASEEMQTNNKINKSRQNREHTYCVNVISMLPLVRNVKLEIIKIVARQNFSLII